MSTETSDVDDDENENLTEMTEEEEDATEEVKVVGANQGYHNLETFQRKQLKQKVNEYDFGLI